MQQNTTIEPKEYILLHEQVGTTGLITGEYLFKVVLINYLSSQAQCRLDTKPISINFQIDKCSM